MGKPEKGKPEKGKAKKKTKRTAPDAVAMKKVKGGASSAAPKDNPFESIWSRRKFNILGQKRKGDQRRVGLARSRAIDKRKDTLLKEYERSGKASVFEDKRIGENNNQLGEFDKGIMRAQRESQMKLGKKSRYNLSDDEEDDPGFLGLGNHDDFEDDIPLDDYENADGEEQLTVLKNLSAHGMENADDLETGVEDENRHKTKKEVMKEIILKSKFFKAQKAKDKEETEQLMDKLDKSFSSLVESRVLLSVTEPGKINALNALAHTAIPKEMLKKELANRDMEVLEQDKPDSYDKLVKEMSLDMRARPSDRTKTPEEIAQAERERLEKLEEERQKRMVEADDSSEDEDDDLENPRTKQIRSVSGDDLGGSLSLAEEPQTKKGWVDEILDKEDSEDSGNEHDSSEDSKSGEDGERSEDTSDEDADAQDLDPSLRDWIQSDEDDVGASSEEEGGDFDEDEIDLKTGGNRPSKSDVAIKSKNNMLAERMSAKKTKVDSNEQLSESDIPFVIEAPSNYEELCALVENRPNADVLVVINRIRACNAIKLAAENRKKIQVFYGILLQYFAVLASKKPLNFELLNLLVKPLMEISVEIPYFSAICARQRISHTRAQFCEAVKNHEYSCWPSFKTLSLLRLWFMIFPCSDFRHAVITPATLLICEYLMRCPILSGRDIAIGSFLSSIILPLSKQSQKFYPEAIIFLQSLLTAASGRKLEANPESQFCRPIDVKALRPLLCVQSRVKEISPLNFHMVMDMPEDSPFFSSDDFRASMLLTVIETLKGFVETCKGLSSFPEVFTPIDTLLLELAHQENLPAILIDRCREVSHIIKEKVDELHMVRRPLQMRKQKPVPIKLLNPKYEESFVKGRDYDPDRERADRKKLKKKIGREAKGAARELRKDNHFLMEVKNKEKALLQQEKAEKYGQARLFLQDQEHGFKSGQLGKGKKRRR